jgi:asparagine synthase (glutamine-hydrolysing)
LNTTTFADIERFPPAHYMICSEGGLHQVQYWTLARENQIRYKQAGDYVNHFRELLQVATNDRLRSNNVGILMSGGLDSTSIAAVANELLSEQYESHNFAAYTAVYDWLIPDKERYYSQLTADALDIPIHYLCMDDYKLFEYRKHPAFYSPEPSLEPLKAMWIDQLEQISASTNILLCGEGADEVLFPSTMVDVLRASPSVDAITNIIQFIVKQRKLPPVGSGILLKFKRWRKQKSQQRELAKWLNEDFVARFDLQARWQQFSQVNFDNLHPVRPKAYGRVTMSMWQTVFEGYDASMTKTALEVRYPLLDIRLVDYLFAIPPITWCNNKEILRRAMYGKIPEAVRLRAKTPLGYPVYERLGQKDSMWIDEYEPVPELSKYVIRDLIPSITGGVCSADEAAFHMQPFGLNQWLQNLGSKIK